jgi:hypothetical protein
MDAAAEWNDLAAPWRAVAERLGFRLLDRKVYKIRVGYTCTDYLIDGATYLDLAGSLGNVHGFSSATLKTWIDGPEGRFSLTTIAVAVPRPRPRGALGWFLGEVASPLLRKLAPESDRPVLMRSPADLELAVKKHAGEILAIGGKLLKFEGNSLESRFEQERRDEKLSPGRD